MAAVSSPGTPAYRNEEDGQAQGTIMDEALPQSLPEIPQKSAAASRAPLINRDIRPAHTAPVYKATSDNQPYARAA